MYKMTVEGEERGKKKGEGETLHSSWFRDLEVGWGLVPRRPSLEDHQVGRLTGNIEGHAGQGP